MYKLNEHTIDFIKAKGDLKAVALSRPHYCSTITAWTATFDYSIYIHQSDEHWVPQKDHHVQLGDSSKKALWDGIRLINMGGHFPGSSILRNEVERIKNRLAAIPFDALYEFCCYQNLTEQAIELPDQVTYTSELRIA